MRRSLAASLLAVFAAAACGPSSKIHETRAWSDHYAFRISVTPTPPVALDYNIYRIVVQDKKSGEPIEGGEGRIFATSKDGANTDDGFKKEKEVGTYSARLFYPTGGDWPIAIQFRRDKNPKTPLERVDWIQTVTEDTTIGPGPQYKK